MIRALALTATLTAALTATQPQAQPQTYTAYTPDGAEVVMVSTDPSRHDDDKILTMDESAELYLIDCGNEGYTLYTIGPEGVVELWGYGWGTAAWSDDIVADWQTWSYPSVAACEGYR